MYNFILNILIYPNIASAQSYGARYFVPNTTSSIQKTKVLWITEQLNCLIPNTTPKRWVQNVTTPWMPNNMVPYKLEVTIVFELNVISVRLNLTIFKCSSLYFLQIKSLYIKQREKDCTISGNKMLMRTILYCEHLYVSMITEVAI